jgi:hypothetical protein
VGRQLVAQHGVIDLSEDDERLVDGVQGFERAICRNFDDSKDVVGVGVSPSRGKIACHGDRLDGVLSALVETSDAAEGNRKVAVGSHRRSASRRCSGQGRRVVFRRSTRIRQPHRQVTERHRRRGVPRAILQALGNVLGEAQRLRGVWKAAKPEFELGLRQMQIELLA